MAYFSTMQQLPPLVASIVYFSFVAFRSGALLKLCILINLIALLVILYMDPVEGSGFRLSVSDTGSMLFYLMRTIPLLLALTVCALSVMFYRTYLSYVCIASGLLSLSNSFWIVSLDAGVN